MFRAEEVFNKVSQFAKEVHVTVSTPTFCIRFVNSTSLAINEKSYFILSAHRPVTFVGIFDVPLNLLMRLLLNDSKISSNVR